MAIDRSNHRALYSNTVIAQYNDMQRPVFGFAGFFPKVVANSLYVSVEVERNRELMAVDILRCTDARLNKFDTLTEKMYQPPYYKEGFAINQCDAYSEVFTSKSVNLRSESGQRLFNNNVKKLDALRMKIERAVELQRAQALQTGIVELKSGDNIDYKRLPESMKVLAGTAKWDAPTTADPFNDIKVAGQFLREKGKSVGNFLNVIMGETAHSNFMQNDKVLAQADSRRIDLIKIDNPVMDNKTGIVYHGVVSMGDFQARIYTYNNTYEALENGVYVTKQYLDTNNVIVLPNDFQGKTAFGALPVIFEGGANGGGQFVANMATDFYVRDYVDQVKMNWMHEISSAPLVVPVSVDRIYTIKTA